MRTYEPIPIPFKQKLKEFRTRFLPVVVFLISGIAVFFLWSDKVSSPGMIGKAVAGQAEIRSPGSGILINFHHRPFERVFEGQLIGQVFPGDSLLLEARIMEARAEIDRIEQSLDVVSGEQRTRINLEELRIDLVRTRINLAETVLRKNLSEAELIRLRELRNRELIAEQEFERAETAFNLLLLQEEELTSLIAGLEDRLDELERFSGYGTRADRDPVLAAIRVQEQRIEVLRAEMAPIPVYASINGIISNVTANNGEYVTAGTPLTYIDAPAADYVVGYVRQPISVEPYQGMKVQVTTRRPGRNSFISEVIELGGQMQLIDPQLQRPGVFSESGIPVKVSLAESGEISLIPGEIVDIYFVR
ncbi:MAG: HlyD family efflux transporter periplasmic adaptor subunit [Balneolaceae bacterium]|nr:MAG: HlyD family efflux transporter periplasmic adaptor subunit [Balneolaceae bacterium]